MVADPFREREEAVKASASGLVIGRTSLPLVNEGEALFHIAPFEKLESAAKAVAAFHEELSPDTDIRPPMDASPSGGKEPRPQPCP